MLGSLFSFPLCYEGLVKAYSLSGLIKNSRRHYQVSISVM